jgi:hypothetical protein
MNIKTREPDGGGENGGGATVTEAVKKHDSEETGPNHPHYPIRIFS